MRKIICLLFGIMVYSCSFGEITVKVHEPIRFKEHNTRAISASKLIGVGVLEVTTDNEMEDLGKKIEFKFPQKGLMTNRKNTIEVEKILIEDKENKMIIMNEKEYVKVYAILDKKNLSNKEKAELIEGEYIGRFPIIMSVYTKK